MSAATDPLSEELMYGGTVRDLQLEIGRGALVAQVEFQRLFDATREGGRQELTAERVASFGANYGNALVAVLSMLAAKDPTLANRAANIIHDVAANGDSWSDWGKDVWEQIVGEAASKAEQGEEVSA